MALGSIGNLACAESLTLIRAPHRKKSRDRGPDPQTVTHSDHAPHAVTLSN
jgi:hypothetical protein